MTAQFILASGSSRRKELLDQIGWRYEIMAAEIDESPRPGESPLDYVCRMATGKARRAAEMQRSKLPILAADTVVIIAGEILGKPATAQQAGQMLKRLSGRTHDVLTAVVLLVPAGGESLRVNESRVTFAHLDAGWITTYCASGEPLDKAGGYAIQGGAAQFIIKLEGSYSGVMGLPLFETGELLRGAGIRPCPGNQ